MTRAARIRDQELDRLPHVRRAGDPAALPPQHGLPPFQHGQEPALPEDVERRAAILNKWWNGTLRMLDCTSTRPGLMGTVTGQDLDGSALASLAGQQQPVAGVDRPTLLEATTLIMRRPEWGTAHHPTSAPPGSIAVRARTGSLVDPVDLGRQQRPGHGNPPDGIGRAQRPDHVRDQPGQADGASGRQDVPSAMLRRAWSAGAARPARTPSSSSPVSPTSWSACGLSILTSYAASRTSSACRSRT